MYIQASQVIPLPVTNQKGNNKPGIRVIRRLLSVMFYLMVGIVLLMASPRIFGCQFVTIETGSMRPALPIGSVCLIQKADIKDLKPGDIITFYAVQSEQDIIVTHRVLFEGTDTVYTKGDANDVRDKKPIGQEQLIGKVLFSVPVLGYVFEVLDIWYIKAFVITVIGILFTAILMLERNVYKPDR